MTYDQIIRESSIIVNQETSRETVADRVSYCYIIAILRSLHTCIAEFEEQRLIDEPNEIVKLSSKSIGANIIEVVL